MLLIIYIVLAAFLHTSQFALERKGRRILGLNHCPLHNIIFMFFTRVYGSGTYLRPAAAKQISIKSWIKMSSNSSSVFGWFWTSEDLNKTSGNNSSKTRARNGGRVSNNIILMQWSRTKLQQRLWILNTSAMKQNQSILAPGEKRRIITMKKDVWRNSSR